jgi:ribosomal subunit interface protein
MQINITHQDFELTDAIKTYADNKFSNVSKYINQKDGAILNINIGKISLHHKHGNHYEVKSHLHFGDRHVHIEAVSPDVYASIDENKDKLIHEINEGSDRKMSIAKKFARKFKQMIRLEK